MCICYCTFTPIMYISYCAFAPYYVYNFGILTT